MKCNHPMTNVYKLRSSISNIKFIKSQKQLQDTKTTLIEIVNHIKIIEIPNGSNWFAYVQSLAEKHNSN